MQYQNFDEIDFNKLYMHQKEKSTFKAKAKESWDKKAPSMNQKVHKSIYNEQFIKLLDLDGIDSLLDVGCGVGNLSLRLAAKFSQVYSLDYSPKMLEILEENAKEQNILNIKTINKSWYDLWNEVPNADLVIASRSMEVKDMKEALTKLNDKANKKVALSYKVGGSFVSNEILEVLKRDIIKKPDYIYLLNILYAMGIRASLNFVQSEGRGTIYTSKEKFIESVSWSIGDLSSDEINSLENYYDNLDKDKRIDEEFVYWAIISWDKKIQ